MPLFVLGLIVCVGFLLILRYTGDKSKKKIRARWTDVKPEGEAKSQQYKKSSDGKVVYLYDDEEEPKGDDPDDKKD